MNDKDTDTLMERVNELIFDFETADTPGQRNKLRTLIISVIEEMVNNNELDHKTLNKIKETLVYE